jgi:hypothetical protein
MPECPGGTGQLDIDPVDDQTIENGALHFLPYKIYYVWLFTPLYMTAR